MERCKLWPSRIAKHIKIYHQNHVEYHTTNGTPNRPYNFDIDQCIDRLNKLKQAVKQKQKDKNANKYNDKYEDGQIYVDVYIRIKHIMGTLQDIKTLMCPNKAIKADAEAKLTSYVTEMAIICKGYDMYTKFYLSFIDMIFICSHCGHNDSLGGVLKCGKCPRSYCHECWDDAFINKRKNKCKICSDK